MIRVLVGAAALVWAAVGIAASVAIARGINVVQDPDGVPLDLRTAVYVHQILAAAEVGR